MSKIDSLMEIIDQNQETVDGDFAGDATASNKPVEVTRDEIDKLMGDFSAEEQETLLNNTNNTEVYALCARAPHAAQYVREEMNIQTIQCETKGVYEGKELPVKVPAKPSYSWDGYALRMPNGKDLVIAKSKALEWLLANTYGMVIGGDEGKSLRVAEVSSKSLNAKKQPLTVKRTKLSAYNEDDILVTYELDTEDDSTPKTVTRTIRLEAGDEAVGDDGKKLNLSGKVRNFPVFRRKPEFVEDLGRIGGRGATPSRIPTRGIDHEEAFKSYLHLVAVSRKAGQAL